MANTRKRLGANAIAAIDTFYDLYTCPSGTQATVKVTAVNRGATTPTIRVAHRTSSGDPVDADYLEYGTQLEADSGGSKTFDWTACLSAGDRIVVRSSSTDVTFIAEGMEHA